MNKIKQIWRYFRPNEPLMFILGFFCVLAIFTLVAMFRSSRETFSLRYENSSSRKRQSENVSSESSFGEDDRNVRYAERVRDASSIGLGLSLYLLRERITRNRVLTLNEVLREFSRSELLPPTCEVLFPVNKTDYGVIKTPRGMYFIRYSAIPLQLEILSGGIDGLADGATFILRVPDTSASQSELNTSSPRVKPAGAWATLFEAPESENHYIPPPFAPLQTFKSLNWQPRSLQQVEFSPERLEELNRFLQSQ